MIEAIIGGLISGTLVTLVDRVRPRKRAYKPPKPKPPVCGCGHNLALHDPATSRCNVTVKTLLKRSGPIKNEDGYRIIGYKEEEFSYPPCGCRQYVGPEPLPSVYAQEIAQ